MTLAEMLRKRAELVAQARLILDNPEGENGDISASQNETYENIDKQIDKLSQRIQREQTLMAVPVLDPEPTPSPDADPPRPTFESRFDRTTRAVAALNTPEYRSGFEATLRQRFNNIHNRDWLMALEVGVNSEGGFLVPEEFETTLVTTLDEFNVMRGLSNVISTGSDRNIPVESDAGTADWIGEEATYPEDDPAFGQVVLQAHKVGRIIKVSEELVEDAFFDISSYVAMNGGRVIGLKEEAAFVNGDGTAKPTGVVVGSSLGVTAAGTAAITSDELIDVYHALKRPYRARAVWLMKDSTVKLIRKLKDTTNQYIWQPGLQAGEPDMLLNRRLETSDGMPAATTGLKSVVFGDMSFYTIADRGVTAVQRLDELYAATGQIGYRVRRRVDGKLTLAEAVKHLIQA